ncbi:MAG: RNA methyltransferase [Candidatus Omnitrophota bacterium]
MKLYGKNPVLERLKSSPKSILRIYIQEGHFETDYIRMKAKKWGIPVLCVPRSKMVKMGRSLNTQGLLMDVEDYFYVPFGELLDSASQRNESLLFLDGLNDPQNLGAIIRSLACLGHFSLVLPSHDSVEVTEAALRVSAGGDNYVKVAKVSNLNQAILAAKEAGFWIAGAVVEGGENLSEAKLPFPLALVVGSEEKGIREVIKKRIDIKLTIPMAQPRLSLNAAHATTIFCYEITKQKKQNFRKSGNAA